MVPRNLINSIDVAILTGDYSQPLPTTKAEIVVRATADELEYLDEVD
jgi:hypothetical protein